MRMRLLRRTAYQAFLERSAAAPQPIYQTVEGRSGKLFQTFLLNGYLENISTKCSLERKEKARIEIVVVLSVQLGNTLASQM